MKNTFRNGRRQKGKVPVGRPLFFVLTISITCLSLLSQFSCQYRTPGSDTVKPATKTETSSGAPKVSLIDAEGLKDLLKPKTKPLLVNFWATWCGPCREEFPDLVKIATDHKDKIDLITISLDELSEIDGEVPKFLAEMGSSSPAYLLKTSDEGAAMAFVSKDWTGALPFTILYNGRGETVYSVQGKFRTGDLVTEIAKIP